MLTLELQMVLLSPQSPRAVLAQLADYGNLVFSAVLGAIDPSR